MTFAYSVTAPLLKDVTSPNAYASCELAPTRQPQPDRQPREPPSTPHLPWVRWSIKRIASTAQRIARPQQESGLSRRFSRLDQAAYGSQFAACIRQWLVTSFSSGAVTLYAKVCELPGDERQYRRRQVADDRILDAVEIGRPLSSNPGSASP